MTQTRDMSDTDRIQQLLLRTPGLKAQQIATELGLDKSQVTAVLHSLRGGEVAQDSSYRWWPRTPETLTSGAASAPRTFLANLCRYYLECLARESGAGISIPAADRSGYVALSHLPFSWPKQESPETERAIRKIVQKTRRERGQLTLYIGYAVRLRSVVLENHDEMRIEPVLLYPLEEGDDERDPLRPASGIPLFNLEVLRGLQSVDSGNLIDEAIQLSEELGLANAEDDLPPMGRDRSAAAESPAGLGLARGPQSVRAFRGPSAGAAHQAWNLQSRGALRRYSVALHLRPRSGVT